MDVPEVPTTRLATSLETIVPNQCQTIDFVQRAVVPGFAVLWSDSLNHKVRAFNNNASFMRAEQVSVRVDDIQDFFTRAPRCHVIECLQWATNELRRGTGHYFISIPRNDYPNSPSWLYADSPGSNGWRTLKKRKVLTTTTSQYPLPSDKYFCLAIVDLPHIVTQDWKFAYFLSRATSYRPLRFHGWVCAG